MSETRTNQEWLHDLNASGPLQETAIADLRNLLLRAALYFFSRNLNDFGGLNRDEILQRAEDCAQDALIALLNHLSDFRWTSPSRKQSPTSTAITLHPLLLTIKFISRHWPWP